MFPNLRNFLWIILYPLAVLWSALVSIRRRCFGARGYRSKLPVLCVGNLHSGGSSKTPVVIELAKYFRDRKPVVISRGYRRRSKAQAALVDLTFPGGATEFGDEPWLIANETLVPVWVARNRGTVASQVEAGNLGRVFIMDDGFQNFTLRKKVSLICITTSAKLTEANTLPLGGLREPLEGLRSADAVLLIRGYDDLSFEIWREYLNNQWPALPFYEVKPHYTVPSSVRSGKWVAFSGIAGPERFRETLKESNCHCELVIFEDHHAYTDADGERLMREKLKHEAVGLVTTQKDYYKAVEVFKKFNEKLEFVKMEVKIEGLFWDFLEDRMKAL